jgi:hypothetical protein
LYEARFSDQEDEVDNGWTQMRPNVDKLIVYIEQRENAVPDAVQLVSVAPLNMWIDLHPHRRIVKKQHSPDGRACLVNVTLGAHSDWLLATAGGQL